MLSWPNEDVETSDRLRQLNDLACNVVDSIADQGWSLISMPEDQLLRDTAILEARSLSIHTSLRREFLPDYLGQDGNSKVGILDDRSGDLTWGLQEVDAELTALCKLLAPITPEALGLTCAGRKKERNGVDSIS